MNITNEHILHQQASTIKNVAKHKFTIEALKPATREQAVAESGEKAIKDLEKYWGI